MNRKAEMGVGTLIIFIAMLLVAAVAAGVLIQTVGSLQEKSLATGQQAKTQISTNAEVVEVSATDGRTQNLTDFEQRMKLSPGSDPIKLDQVIFTFNTKDQTSTLKYRGSGSICQKNNVNGYNTWNAETVDEAVAGTFVALAEDLDDDGAIDYVRVASSTVLQLNLSTAGLINGTVASLAAASTSAVDLSTTTLTYSAGGVTYATITFSGETNTNDTIDADIMTVTPYREGEGYFSVIYEQTGSNHVAGNLQRGDIIRLCFESPGPIGESELIRLNFIPKIGVSTLTQFISPDVISTERVYLYP